MKLQGRDQYYPDLVYSLATQPNAKDCLWQSLATSSFIMPARRKLQRKPWGMSRGAFNPGMFYQKRVAAKKAVRRNRLAVAKKAQLMWQLTRMVRGLLQKRKMDIIQKFSRPAVGYTGGRSVASIWRQSRKRRGRYPAKWWRMGRR